MWSTHSKDPKKAGKIKNYWWSVEDQNHVLPELAVLHARKVNKVDTWKDVIFKYTFPLFATEGPQRQNVHMF